MIGQGLLPLLTLGTSVVAAVIIFALREHQHRERTTVNLAAALLKLSLVVIMGWGVAQGEIYELRWAFRPGLDIVLRADQLSIVFAGLSSLLWLCTTVYAIGYLEGAPGRSRFFGFFSFCVASTMGVALAGNLFTFLIFYEILTLATYPLVVHRGTRAALNAGRTYVTYALAGGAVLMVGVVWLHTLAGTEDFQPGGYLLESARAQPLALTGIFVLLVAGLGVKAALVPFHSWLPAAMVAPAPVSALLHAVAVVKAGAFGLIRVAHDLYGAEAVRHLGVGGPLAVLAGITILYGSVRALQQQDLKRRLAFSTVSQVSYITLGAALLGPAALIGAIVHLIHQGIMKITLFFCAGNYAETRGLHRIDELDGMGRCMPLTSAAFSVAALGMIGMPPLAGFISKWWLGLGALGAGQGAWVVPILVASTLLNAAYFLPIINRLWFREPGGATVVARSLWQMEAHAWLLWPTLFTGLFVILAGVLAGMPFSPLVWAHFMVREVYAL
ncbi:MAG: proton-conducting transporter membrane subunit [Halospina sp.]